MRKPSIFSSNYREQMRRRRINIILIVLILISAVFFGVKYYISNDIKFLKGEKAADIQKGQKNDNKQAPDKSQDNKSQANLQNPGNEQKQAEGKNISYYEYKTAEGGTIKVEYTVQADRKEIIGLKEDNSTVSFDISPDKQRIVFEDKASGDIVLGDVNNTFIKIQLKEYISKASGVVIKQESTVKNKPWHIWAQKPHFTSDGRVVYVSHLPFVKKGNNLYLWTVNMDGTGHKFLGKLGYNINNISYDGFDEKGGLKIKDGDKSYYLAPGANHIALQ
ncbi:hypothetical protein [Fonticella tunisiensis]|uniref:WD40 repeat protein n=1 Tax=Fonticella tunisiensis TaxID=1096341 RepID=A0A4R7KRY3_9CLOT|nr:hypothetical protein [Fonticella tunisiensis]TDT58423.1 hypothetical protein EDD71_11171 [Fonticella tunisiensis]